MVPMAWLSRPGSLASPSSSRTGLGLRFTAWDRNRSMRASSAPLVGEPGNLVSELELLQDVLDVGREPVQVGVEVVSELLLRGGVSQVPQGEWRGVEELLPGRLLKGACLV